MLNVIMMTMMMIANSKYKSDESVVIVGLFTNKQRAVLLQLEAY
jgi:hypothetical protein